jgi:branched-chain amino acid aminotransferase
VKYEELSTFSEVMAAGTAAALLPVKSITRKSTSDKFVYQDGANEAGPCGAKLSAMLRAIQKGKIEDTYGWCVNVTEVKDNAREYEPAFNVTKFGHPSQKPAEEVFLDAVKRSAFAILALAIVGFAICVKF